MLWQVAKKFPVLKKSHVHIWRSSFTRTKKETEDFLKILNEEERKRTSRFIVKDAANNFIIARGVLRTLLSKYLNVKPEEIIFQQNKYGKLHLESFSLQFNLSHSGDLALFIFTLNSSVGVDVESVREIDNFHDIARKFFSKQEVNDLFSLPENDQLQAFFNCWSRKEAFIKAKGLGVYHGLNNFSVEVSKDKKGRVNLVSHVSSCLRTFQQQLLSSPSSSLSSRARGSNKQQDVWSLEALDPGDGYAGAFATNLPEYSVEFYDF